MRLLVGIINLVGNKTQSQMNRFKNVLTQCDLHELNFEDYRYTWNNKKGCNMQVRLDKTYANSI